VNRKVRESFRGRP